MLTKDILIDVILMQQAIGQPTGPTPRCPRDDERPPSSWAKSVPTDVQPSDEDPAGGAPITTTQDPVTGETLSHIGKPPDQP